MLVVVGGQSRKVGKSAVVTGLIRALRQARWTAVKISRHSHGSSLENGSYELREETTPGATDSGRCLEAGAVRSYWLQAAGDGLKQAIPALQSILDDSRNIIIESSAIVSFIRPDLYLVVVDPSISEWKESARRQIGRADAFVIVNREVNEPQPPIGAVNLPEGRPKFVVTPPEYMSAELVAYVSRGLTGKAGQDTKGNAINSDNPSICPE